MGTLNRIEAIFDKEFKHLTRDRTTLTMIIMIPLVQLLLFGYAINTDVRNIPAAVVDFSGSAYARRLIQAVNSTQIVSLQQRYPSIPAAELAITRGDVRAALIIPEDFVKRLDSSGVLGQQFGAATNLMETAEPVAQWIVDGSDTLITAALKSLRSMPLTEITDQPVTQSQSIFEVTPYYNPEQRSVVNIAPGLLAIILTMTMTLFTSISLVRERELGNIELLITMPIRPIELMLGKIVPYIFVGLGQAAIILLLSYWVFDVPISGGLLAIMVATWLFILSALVLGLLVSMRAKSQMQAMQLTFFIMMPSILLSGFMFPFEGMPDFAQKVAEILPATHFVRAIRGIALRDANLSDLVFDISWLAVFAVLGLIIASIGFNKRLD